MDSRVKKDSVDRGQGPADSVSGCGRDKGCLDFDDKTWEKVFNTRLRVEYELGLQRTKSPSFSLKSAPGEMSSLIHP